jgi:putative DNA primase/helicase
VSVAEVREAIQRAAVLPLVAAQCRLVALNIKEFLSREIPPREMLLDPILPVQGLMMLHSWRGVGKTQTALGIAYAVACGGVFLCWSAPRPRQVLYLDGEMPVYAMQQRLAALVGASPEPQSPDYFRIITPDLQPGRMPNLATEEGRAAVDAWIERGCELLVVDNISTLCGSAKENEAEGWEPMQSWLLELRRRGVSVILVHHQGKGGAQRGTSKREDILDTVVNLKRPKDYNPSEGARFEVHLDKARGVFGDAAEPFEARMQTRDDGVAVWTMKSLEDTAEQQIGALLAEGRSVRDVAKQSGLSKSKVGRVKQKLEAG